jgi:UDPglucose 6-dehydrogenase
MIERLSFFGLGKLGLPLAALFARSGLPTIAIDIDAALVERLRAGETRFVEPGLDELLGEAASAITYSTDVRAAANTDASIILVATPSNASHPEIFSSYLEDACKELCAVLRARPVWRYHLFVISSTVMPGTMSSRIARVLEAGLGRRAGEDFDIAYVPHFVASGDVVGGFQHPPVLLVGSDGGGGGAEAARLYRRIVAAETPVRILSLRDAELAKIALNVFLCMKISFGNYLAQLGDRLGGADLDAIADTLSLDPRVGAGLLRGGAPYGGTCLPGDIDAFLHLARSVGLDAPLVRASAEVNAAGFDFIEGKLLAEKPRCVALLGLSFKPGTPVMDGSLALELVRRLRSGSIRLVAFDPMMQTRAAARETFGGAVTCCDTLAECLAAADTVVVCNPDPSFAGLAADLPADRRIIDPWGYVRDPHQGLMQLGRTPKDASSGPGKGLKQSYAWIETRVLPDIPK